MSSIMPCSPILAPSSAVDVRHAVAVQLGDLEGTMAPPPPPKSLMFAPPRSRQQVDRVLEELGVPAW
jgi:hypothetical protein